MRTFKATIEYDGTEFSGWQVQPDRRTVAGELSLAIHTVTGERPTVTGAGRTDAGVHAVGQVASFRLETRLDAAVLARALNARLPFDVRVRSVEEAPERFNARFDARSRTYQYLFIRRRTALWRRYLYPVGPSLDIAAMRREAAALVGEGDFAAFSSAEGGSGKTRCRVMAVDLVDTPPVVALTVTADHFLHRMVRMIAGTLLEIGFGKPWRIEEIVASRDRSRAGATLPSFALYLVKVTY